MRSIRVILAAAIVAVISASLGQAQVRPEPIKPKFNDAAKAKGKIEEAKKAPTVDRRVATEPRRVEQRRKAGPQAVAPKVERRTLPTKRVGVADRRGDKPVPKLTPKVDAKKIPGPKPKP